MKTLIFALSLLASSVSAAPSPIRIYPIHAPSNLQRMEVVGACKGLITSKESQQKIATDLSLDTEDKQQAFLNMCSLYVEGLKDGVQLGVAASKDDGNSDGPQGEISSSNRCYTTGFKK